MAARKPVKEKAEQTSLNYRNHAQSVRTWMFFAMFEGIIIVTLAAAIIVMMPLKETQVRFIEFTNSNDNFFTVHPSNMPQETMTMLIRKQLRKYVYNRERKDNITEEMRFREVKAMSSDAVFKQFRDMYMSSQKSLEGVDRDIDIISDTDLGNNIHQIEFRTMDVKDGMIKRTSYLATLHYEVLPHVMNESTALANPMGIRVLKYSISRRNEGE